MKWMPLVSSTWFNIWWWRVQLIHYAIFKKMIGKKTDIITL